MTDDEDFLQRLQRATITAQKIHGTVLSEVESDVEVAMVGALLMGVASTHVPEASVVELLQFVLQMSEQVCKKELN